MSKILIDGLDNPKIEWIGDRIFRLNYELNGYDVTIEDVIDINEYGEESSIFDVLTADQKSQLGTYILNQNY